MSRLEVHCDGRQIAMDSDDAHVKVVFGPHHYINIFKKNGKVTFNMGATHHGIEVDASVVDSETYKLIEYMREAISNKKIKGKTQD